MDYYAIFEEGSWTVSVDFHPFGPTRCGDILYERIKDDQITLLKVTRFYNQSQEQMRHLSSIKALHQRRLFRNAYIHFREHQLLNDLRINHPAREDILKRLRYLVRFGSRQYLSK